MRSLRIIIIGCILLTTSLVGSAQTFELYSLQDFYNLSEDERDKHLTDNGFIYYGEEEIIYLADSAGNAIYGKAYHNQDTTEFVVFTDDVVEFAWDHFETYTWKETKNNSVSYSLNVIFEKQIKRYKGGKVKKFKIEDSFPGLEGSLGDWGVVYDPAGYVVLY